MSNGQDRSRLERCGALTHTVRLRSSQTNGWYQRRRIGVATSPSKSSKKTRMVISLSLSLSLTSPSSYSYSILLYGIDTLQPISLQPTGTPSSLKTFHPTPHFSLFEKEKKTTFRIFLLIKIYIYKRNTHTCIHLFCFCFVFSSRDRPR